MSVCRWNRTTICLLLAVITVGIIIFSLWPVNTSQGCYPYNCSYSLATVTNNNYDFYSILPEPITSSNCWLRIWKNQSLISNTSLCYTPQAREHEGCYNYLPPNGTRCYTVSKYYRANACPYNLFCDNADAYTDRMIIVAWGFLVLTVLLISSFIVICLLERCRQHDETDINLI